MWFWYILIGLGVAFYACTRGINGRTHTHTLTDDALIELLAYWLIWPAVAAYYLINWLDGYEEE